MKKTLCAFALIALLGGCTTTSNDSTATMAKATATAKTAKTEAEQLRDDEIICARQTKTGSHRKSRVCRTVAERKREREQAQEIMRNTQSGSTRAID